MKISLCVSILAVVSAVTVPSATGKSLQSREGIIVNVQTQKVATPPIGTGVDPFFTPLQSHYYLYNIFVQLNCDVYAARYESEREDLPSALSRHNPVRVRLEGHAIYLEFPGDILQMRIVHHTVNTEGACGQTALAR